MIGPVGSRGVALRRSQSAVAKQWRQFWVDSSKVNTQVGQDVLGASGNAVFLDHSFW